MKNRSALLVMLLLICNVAIAQVELSKDFKITVGTPYPVTDAKTKDYFSDSKGHIISVKTLVEKITIQRYDIETMKELSRKDYIDFPEDSKIEKVLHVGDRLFYFYSSLDRKAKQEKLYSREINMTDGTFAEPKFILSSSAKVGITAYSEPAAVAFYGLGPPIRFRIQTSIDNSKILIWYILEPAGSNQAKIFDKVGFYVFDPTMEKQWGGEVTMPYTEKEMNDVSYEVTREGKAFILTYMTASRKFELLSIASNLMVTTNKIDLELDSTVMYEHLNLREDADGNLACTGYLCNPEYNKIMNQWRYNAFSLSYFTLNQEGKILRKYDFTFSKELINQYESARDIEKNEKKEAEGKGGIRDLQLIASSFNPDGSLTMIAEQQYIGSRRSSIGEKITCWIYGDIVATKISKTGELVWMKKLPKTQTAMLRRRKGAASAYYVKGMDAHYILYMDNLENAKLSIDKVPTTYEEPKEGYLTAYKIDDASGSIEKQSLFNIDDINGVKAFQFRITRVFNAVEGVFMLEIYVKDNQDTMVKFELGK